MLGQAGRQADRSLHVGVAIDAHNAGNVEGRSRGLTSGWRGASRKVRVRTETDTWDWDWDLWLTLSKACYWTNDFATSLAICILHGFAFTRFTSLPVLPFSVAQHWTSIRPSIK